NALTGTGRDSRKKTPRVGGLDGSRTDSYAASPERVVYCGDDLRDDDRAGVVGIGRRAGRATWSVAQRNVYHGDEFVDRNISTAVAVAHAHLRRSNGICFVGADGTMLMAVAGPHKAWSRLLTGAAAQTASSPASIAGLTAVQPAGTPTAVHRATVCV